MTENSVNNDDVSTYFTLELENCQDSMVQISDQYTGVGNFVVKSVPICLISEVTSMVKPFPDDNGFSFTPVDSQKTTSATENRVIELQTQIRDTPLKQNQEYKCAKCLKIFQKLSLFKQHLMSHRFEKKFKCEKCSASYNIESNYKIHMALHEGGKPVCPLCDVKFQRFASLKSHLLLHQIEELHTCEVCQAEFEREEELSKHQQYHLRETREIDDLTCSSCQEKFDNPKKLKEHVSQHIKVKRIVFSKRKNRKSYNSKDHHHICQICHKSFAKACLLERHHLVHSGEKPFICPLCNRGFSQRGTLNIHLKKHTGEKPYVCTLCSAKFTQKGNLRVHVKKTHTVPEPGTKVYRCAHCTCIFQKIASLNVHITRCHTTSEPVENISSTIMSQLKVLENETCQMKQEITDHNEQISNETKNADSSGFTYVRFAESFSDGTIRRYIIKQRIVNQMRLYSCNYCDKEFKKPSDTIRHTRVHTKERPFLCKICGTRFSLKSSLTGHMKTHYCNNNNCSHVRYAKPIPTKRPVVTHSSKLSHSLDKNDEKYSVPSVDLDRCTSDNNSNQNLFTGEEKFKCDQCPKLFSMDHSLKSHSLLHQKTNIFQCNVCGTTVHSNSLLKRHMSVHNNKLKNSELYRRRMDIHDEDNIPSKTVNEMERIRNDPFLHDVAGNAAIAKESLKINSSPEKTVEQSVDESLLNQSSFTIAPNSIRVISDKDDVRGDFRQIQAIYINLADFQVIDNSLQHVKVENTDTLLSSSLTDLPENNVFSIDPLNITNLSSEPSEVSTANHMFNIPQAANSDQSNVDLTVKTLKPDVNKTTRNEKPTLTISTNELILNDSFNPDLNFLLSDLMEFNELDENLNTNDINLPEVVNVEDLEAVHQQETDETSIKCDKCNKDFANKAALTKHTYKHTAKTKQVKPLHVCDFCSKGFKKLSDLDRHKRTHTGEKPFKCDKCERRFALKSTLVSHQKTHNPVSQKNYNCSVCNSGFTTKSSLKVHMNLHTGVKPYQCSFCPEKFRTAANKKSHEVSSHNAPPKKKTGDTSVDILHAPIIFDQLNPSEDDQVIQNTDLDNILVVHEQLQLSNQDHLNVLSDVNTESIQLEPNILTHLQSSNFLLQDQLVPLSEFLSLKLDVSQELESNLNIEKPRNLECEICHKKYASKDVLRKHRKIHGVNRKFPCSKCDKGFDTKEALSKHEKVHAGLRPYSCNYCTNSFWNEHSLATHVKRIHVSNTPMKEGLFIV